MPSNKKTPRAKSAAKAVERKVDKAIARERKWYWSFPLIELTFIVEGQVRILRRQIFDKSPIGIKPARHLHQLMNTAALQVVENLPSDVDKSDFKVLEAYVLALNPLGMMTEREFWAGTQEAPQSAAEAAPVTHQAVVVADGETAAADNVVPFTGNATPPSA